MECHAIPPPTDLENAKVLEWAWAGDKPFGFVQFAAKDSAAIPIYGLALCQYENTKEVYRFSCDAHWQVIQDDCYESTEDAKKLLPEQYHEQAINWIKC
ncbi:MAG: hypothetical protein JJT94_06625 [Bernardetiaceae bacterium]|nr:hypothetical protein [Bernardetiaceae bacterium]